MKVPSDMLWIMGLIAFVLKDLIEALLPQKWIDVLNSGLLRHANEAMLRITRDVKAEFLELWEKRTKLLICVGGVVSPLLLVWTLDACDLLLIDPVVGSTILISSAVLTSLGVILLILSATKLCATLAFAIPLYSFFLFVSKCRKGAVVAYSLGISILIFAVQGMAIAS